MIAKVRETFAGLNVDQLSQRLQTFVDSLSPLGHCYLCLEK
jgi:hypothetical protein